ncbi:MAG: Gfo/Idh/MocA family protein [Inquilinus sp.]|uniref:Gfo/Idh/MocA family protein n=1 Tax=Inquilinus sp. TaxID=1932117 RepID=UPI003F3E379C
MVIPSEFRVGIVGASNKASWAKLSHIPAIKGLPGVKLAAVATRNEQSAREAAEAFGADRSFSDPFAMIRDDQIDIVTIAVNVPAHRELVLAALEAGKAVYCEAPLGRCVSETEEMAAAVRSHHTAVGLQGRHNPSARCAAELVSSGRIGRPLSARIASATSGFGPEMRIAHEIFNRSSSGANLLTITGGHTLDLVESILGEIIEVDARAEIRWPIVKLTETGEKSVRDTADYVGVVGKTRSGAAFTAEIDAGVDPENSRFSLEIRGSDGWLNLTSSHPYGFQAGALELTSSVPFAQPDAPTVSAGSIDTAINVGEVYAQLVRDMREETCKTPGFELALHNARLVEAVRQSAESGQRQKIPF